MTRSLTLAFCLSLTSLCAQQVDGGNGHALILDSLGNVYTVGRNTFGQLGDSTFESSTTPIRVTRIPKIAVISRGYDHSLAIDSTGKLWSWGRNNYGQLGVTPLYDYSFPQAVQTNLRFTAVEGGHWHTVAIAEDSTVWAWGHNFYGELGSGDREHSNFPNQVAFKNGRPLKGIVEIASVGYHTLAIDKDGKVYSWGGNSYGQLGHRRESQQLYADLVPDAPSARSVATAWHHSVLLTEEGEVYVWGSDPSTQRREMVRESYEGITKLDLPKIERIAAGSWHVLAIDEEGNTWGWGANRFGMLGTGDSIAHSSPIQLDLPSGICEVGGGCFQSLAIHEDGTIYTMGDNQDGQQGQGHKWMLYDPKVLSLEPPVKEEPVEEVVEKSSISIPWLKVFKYGVLLLSVALNVVLFLKLRKVKLHTP